ncbi:MAG: 23S rRNA (pseudouridine(1915)-N(3))-methyltransferase RlmH [Acidobacteria bacterium]|nr:23S rRNA (pseudouridine(1915)-N(3))-methyltransferase RlmH [Acidobacteriota bacterium]
MAAGAALVVAAVGRTRRGPYLELEEDYLARIARLAPVRRAAVAQSRRASAGERRREEGAALAALAPARGTLVALDSRGKSLSSAELARRLARWRERGETVFAVGGPDGLDETLIQAADFTLAFGPLTLPHELALVVLLEQLYRALSDAAGHPYGRH